MSISSMPLVALSIEPEQLRAYGKAKTNRILTLAIGENADWWAMECQKAIDDERPLQLLVTIKQLSRATAVFSLLCMQPGKPFLFSAKLIEAKVVPTSQQLAKVSRQFTASGKHARSQKFLLELAAVLNSGYIGVKGTEEAVVIPNEYAESLGYILGFNLSRYSDHTWSEELIKQKDYADE